MPQEQNYSNHAKFDPKFHFFLAPVAGIYLIFTIYQAIRNPGLETILHVVIAAWALVAVFTLRLYSLKVQDRVIRLEERLRLKELLPASLQPRIGELTESQLIGLRFASDAELPELVSKALSQNMGNKEIKQAIKNWRPDFFRV